jgi:hypothetical protein
VPRLSRTSSTVSDIFAALTLEKIHLRHIVVDIINDAVLPISNHTLPYLDGWKCLAFTPKVPTNPMLLLSAFKYSCASQARQVLKMQPTLEGERCYSPQVVAALSQCQRLASLTIVLPSMVPAKPSRSSGPSSIVHRMVRNTDPTSIIWSL